MAALTKKNSGMIGAFTLFESVVAVSIITVLVGIATATYGNLMDAEKPLAFYQAETQVDRHFRELNQNRNFINRSFSHDLFEIDQTVDFYQGNKKLYHVQYTVSSGGNTWWTEHHLIANNE